MRERSQRLAEQSQARLQAYAQAGPQAIAQPSPPVYADPSPPAYAASSTSAQSVIVDSPLPDVLEHAVQDSKQLLSQEMRLAKTEMTRKAKAAGKGAGLIGAAGVSGLFALAVLTAAAILGLSLVVEPWLAAVIVGGVYALVAAVLLAAGRSSVREATPFVPEHTVRTLGSLGGKLGRAWQRGQA